MSSAPTPTGHHVDPSVVNEPSSSTTNGVHKDLLAESPSWRNALCVFCGSSDGNDPAFMVRARPGRCHVRQASPCLKQLALCWLLLRSDHILHQSVSSPDRRETTRRGSEQGRSTSVSSLVRAALPSDLLAVPDHLSLSPSASSAIYLVTGSTEEAPTD